MTAETLTQTEAAELEGLVDISKEQLARLRKTRQLKDKIDALNSQLNGLKDEFRAEMEEDALQGLLLNGKVVVRKSDVVSSRIDTKGLKAAHPEIASDFLIVTKTVRLTIN